MRWLGPIYVFDRFIYMNGSTRVDELCKGFKNRKQRRTHSNRYSKRIILWAKMYVLSKGSFHHHPGISINILAFSICKEDGQTQIYSRMV